MSAPLATYATDCYVFTWPDLGVMMTLDRIHESRDVVKGEITVETDISGKIHLASDLNVKSTRSRNEIARALEQREPGDWDARIQQVCDLTLRRWREGEPFVDMAGAPPGTGRPLWLCYPYVLSSGVSILFGDGSAGKSTIAIMLAAVVAGRYPLAGLTSTNQERVGYLDWEADLETHNERLAAICNGYEPGTIINEGLIWYSRQSASLVEMTPTIRRHIAEKGIGFAIVDSLGGARGGEPESAELTLRMFMAMRSWGIPVLALDHISKAQAESNGHRRKSRPFGSAYTYNYGRNLWSIERIEQEGAELAPVVALSHVKINRGALVRGRIGYRMVYEADSEGNLRAISVDETNLMAIPEARKGASISQRMVAALREAGTLTTKELVEAVNDDGPVAEETVGRLLRRFKSRLFVQLTEGKWGLAATSV